MKPKPGLPQNVRLSEGLGISAPKLELKGFEEPDDLPIEDSIVFVAPEVCGNTGLNLAREIFALWLPLG